VASRPVHVSAAPAVIDKALNPVSKMSLHTLKALDYGLTLHLSYFIILEEGLKTKVESKSKEGLRARPRVWLYWTCISLVFLMNDISYIKPKSQGQAKGRFGRNVRYIVHFAEKEVLSVALFRPDGLFRI
jgi:hypothetical protein